MATTIAISIETKEKIRNLGRAGDSYDDIINKMYEVTRKHMLETYLYNTDDSISLEEFKEEIEKKWPKSK